MYWIQYIVGFDQPYQYQMYTVNWGACTHTSIEQSAYISQHMSYMIMNSM